MTNFNPNDILKFKYFFTSVNKHHDEENLKFKEKTYDDIENFVKNILDNAGIDQEYVGGMLTNFISELLQMKVGLEIAPHDHLNAYKIQNFVLEYFGELVADKFKPIKIGPEYNLKQIVWLFKVLQQNDVITNYQVDLIDTLSALLNEKKGTIKTYLGLDNSEEPAVLFKNISWDDLFK
jgi:hypothetical protein